jgi:hypothetical protein
MENRIAFFRNTFVALVFLLSSCDNFFKDLSENDDLADPEIVITPLSKDLLADGMTETSVYISIVSDREIPEARRKVTISTSIGSLIINGELKNTSDILLDEVGKKTILLRHPLNASEGTITISAMDGKTEQASVKFGAANPESVSIEVPRTTLKDTAAMNVTAILFRQKGNVSVGLPIVFELIDNQAVAVEKVLFHSTSKSDSSGRSRSVIVLEKPAAGSYKIRVGYKMENGTLQYLNLVKPITVVSTSG